MNVPALITHPARPIQGGRLELAPPKRGLWYAEPKLNSVGARSSTRRLGRCGIGTGRCLASVFAAANLAGTGVGE